MVGIFVFNFLFCFILRKSSEKKSFGVLVSSFLIKSRYKTTSHGCYEESRRTVNKILKVPGTQQEFRW